jgi:pimeloyl-ACP methyl ester carboxylesterase
MTIERPVYIPFADAHLFGVVTEPDVPNGRAAVVLPGGGGQLALNRNRWNVRLCRELARRGFRALRIDFHGMGESSGFVQRLGLHDLFDQDVLAAVHWLEEQGNNRPILVGSCFGARSALLAGSAIEDVDGLVLISPPVRDFRFGERTATRTRAHGMTFGRYLRLAFRPEVVRGFADADLRQRYLAFARRKIAVAWKRARGHAAPSRARSADESATFFDPLRGAFRRGVPTLLLYGEDEDYYEEFRRHLDGLAPLFQDPSSSVRLMTLPGIVHGFIDLETQDSSLDLVLSWIAGITGESPESRLATGIGRLGEPVEGRGPAS